MQPDFIFRVVLFPDPFNADVWIAQAIDRDIAAHGADIEEAKRAFIQTVEGYAMLAQRHQMEPFSTLKPAPRVFWDIWNKLAEESRVERMSPASIMLPVVTYDSVSAGQ